MRNEPVNIDNDATYELEDFDPIHREDADDVEASEDADGFSAAKEEPEPEPGPESTLAQDVREAYVRDFAAAKESRTCFLSSSAAVLSAWREADLKRAPEFNCLPDAKAGWDLHLQRDGQHVLWWHKSLLQLFNLVSFRSRHLSADAFCSALLDNWEQNGIHRPVSVLATTLRKCLRQALLYMDCQGVVDDYLEGALSTWPRGALNGCPCCGDTPRCSSAGSGAAAAAPAPVTGAAVPGVVEEAAAVEGPDPGLEHTEVAAGSPAATEGNPVPPVPSAGAAAPGTMTAAVSTGAAVLGAAVLVSTDWLLQDTCSPEAAGPGPTSLHSVHFDACFKLNLLFHKGYVSGYTQLDGAVTSCPTHGYSRCFGMVMRHSRLVCHTARTLMLTRWVWVRSQGPGCGIEEALSFLAAGTAVLVVRYRVQLRMPERVWAPWGAWCGTGDGRASRDINSVAGPHGRTTQYMNPVTREAHLERVARLCCRDVVRNLPARLWRMQTQAEAALDSARHRIRVLGAALEHKGGDAAVVQQSLQQQPRQLEAADVVPASPAAEYAHCRLTLQKLQREDTLDASSDAAAPSPYPYNKNQAADLEKADAYDPAAWGPESELMSAALGSLVKGELRKLFAEDAVVNMHALEHVVQ
ncbi:hypothetical protein VOLCADRAFT_105536 [Volvox carteri f. nagariensis]|uniref:Uncharacterized protein n=1 Tax=Volvox carteri f. nagariensis TaxID=3068 RepID=D8U1G0_VOLCA|nr:uncharacterized protein VOLCADRAFT_105536 [Volvox carteri f. nagariensis]EFJ46407.1 hypothetical protein VOLCADRAFT_105536 [Volvox carteri f. nagariensis]|eukprot:XP_002952560.1 hypothetical protein VOLCADRAFT_105536 [Volvox carteri f. nagariensis]